MKRIIFISMFLATSISSVVCFRRRTGLRVLYGVPDTKHKYSFVVALVSAIQRHCTGILLSAEWVLTAAHCITCDICDITHVQYGNMLKFPNSTRSKNSIYEQISHPGYQPESGKDDIALLRVSPLSMSLYGKISAVDYGSLIGLAVEYAGFGTTQYNDVDDDRRPLLIGEGVIRSCFDILEDIYSPGRYLCVAPKCSNSKGDAAPGDSGGPLFYDGKIIGLVSSGTNPIGVYTAVSPYITWIHQVMTADHNRRRLIN